MDFSEHWDEFSKACPLDIEDKEIAEWAWDRAYKEGIKEGIKRALSADSREYTMMKLALNQE